MDPDQLSALYRSYSPELIASLQRRFPWSSDVVEDAVQHGFLALQTASPPPDEPRAWLRVVAHHYIIDRLRADGKLVSDEGVIGAAAAETGSAGSTTSPALTPSLVQRALRMLTGRAQRLLRGKYEQGKTYGTLAREEGLAKSGMGRILSRARDRLRRAVDELRRPE